MSSNGQSEKSSAYLLEFNKANRKRHTSTGKSCIAVPEVKIPKTVVGPTTLELEMAAIRRRKILKITSIVVAIILVLAMTITSTLAYMEYKSYKPAFQVYINDQLIGTVHSEQEFHQCMERVKEEISQILQKEVIFEQTPTFSATKVKEQFFTPLDEIEQNIKSTVNISVGAYAIMVDGIEMGIVKDKDTAYAILQDVMEPYKPEDPDIKIGFNRDVKVEKVYVRIGEIREQEDVYNDLVRLEEEIKTYTVRKGDNLWDIALDHKIPVEEILRMNPGMTEIIQPGQEIKLSIPKPVLGVETREKIVYNEDIPFEIKEIEDPDLFEGRRSIIEKGANGEKRVEAEVIRVNGVETGKEILNELILADAKVQTEKVGTKPLPPKYGTGSFRRPLYGALTSRFGMRWGRMHNGIDIAGNTGDPVYAADGGKVIYAGWLGNYGYLVKIHHDNEYVTYYGHNSKLLVKTGQRVAKGEIIARVGSTGRSTGPHLHFEVRKNGTPVNPLSYLP